MIKLVEGPVLIINGREIYNQRAEFEKIVESKTGREFNQEEAKKVLLHMIF